MLLIMLVMNSYGNYSVVFITADDECFVKCEYMTGRGALGLTASPSSGVSFW